MSRETAEQYLSYKTFFNIRWTDKQAVTKGVSNAATFMLATGGNKLKVIKNIHVPLVD